MARHCEEYLCTKCAARVLGVSPSALEKGRVGYGAINPPYVKFGRAVRYSAWALTNWANGPRRDRVRRERGGR